MCVEQELSERHAKRRQLKNKTRTSRRIDREKRGRLTKRGPINVPLVLAAIEADVIDALGPLKILGSRLPRVADTPVPVSLAEISAQLEHRRREDEQAKALWLAQHPYAGLSAA
jgi:hypothetical protein